MRGMFKDWRDEVGTESGDRTVDYVWTVLARVLSVAKDRDKLKVNICGRGCRLYDNDRSDKVWEESYNIATKRRRMSHMQADVVAVVLKPRQLQQIAFTLAGPKGPLFQISMQSFGAREFAGIMLAAIARQRHADDLRRHRSSLSPEAREGHPQRFVGQGGARATNIAKHRISLARVSDFVEVAVLVDDRFDYGETRYRAWGHIEGVAYYLA